MGKYLNNDDLIIMTGYLCSYIMITQLITHNRFSYLLNVINIVNYKAPHSHN